MHIHCLIRYRERMAVDINNSYQLLAFILLRHTTKKVLADVIKSCRFISPPEFCEGSPNLNCFEVFYTSPLVASNVSHVNIVIVQRLFIRARDRCFF